MFTRLCNVSNINWEVGVRERGDMHSKLAKIKLKSQKLIIEVMETVEGRVREEGEQLKFRVPGSLAQWYDWGLNIYPNSSRTWLKDAHIRLYILFQWL